MKNIMILCFVVLILNCTSFAELIHISPEDSVKRSDFIVVGTLRSVTPIYEEERVLVSVTSGDGEGVLVIDKMIAGIVFTDDGRMLGPGNELRLRWREQISCLSGWHKRVENEKGIWLLTIGADGAIQTGHPAQFVSIDKLSKINAYIKKHFKQFSEPLTVKSGDDHNKNTIPLQTGTKIAPSPEGFGFSEDSNYSLFRAIVMFAASLAFYWLLYRGRLRGL